MPPSMRISKERESDCGRKRENDLMMLNNDFFICGYMGKEKECICCAMRDLDNESRYSKLPITHRFCMLEFDHLSIDQRHHTPTPCTTDIYMGF